MKKTSKNVQQRARVVARKIKNKMVEADARVYFPKKLIIQLKERGGLTLKSNYNPGGKNLDILCFFTRAGNTEAVSFILDLADENERESLLIQDDPPIHMAYCIFTDTVTHVAKVRMTRQVRDRIFDGKMATRYYIDVVQVLLKYKTQEQLLLQDIDGDCPIHRAIRDKDAKFLNTLLQFDPKKQVKLRNKEGWMALRCCIEDEFVIGLKMVLPYCSQDNINDPSQALLFRAAKLNHPWYAQQLMEAGADPMVISKKYGVIPAFMACSYNNAETLSVLLTRNPEKQLLFADSTRSTILHVACGKGASDCVVKILSFDFLQKEKYLLTHSDNGTPLFLALYAYSTAVKKADVTKANDSATVVKILLQHCPEKQLSEKHSNGKNYLKQFFSVNVCLDLIPLLNFEGLPLSAFLNVSGSFNAAHMLGDSKKPKVVPMLKRLVMAHEDLVLIGTDPGQLPIHNAILHGSLDMVRAMLTVKRIEQLDYINNGIPLAFYALGARDSYEKLKLLLSEYDYDLTEILRECSYLDYSISRNKLRCARFLLKRKTPIGPQFSRLTHLHYVCIKGFLKMAKLLVENGYDVNACVKGSKETPLHIAAKEGHLEIVKFLLSCDGIEIDPKDKNGRTPLFCAVSTNRISIAKLLIEKGADKSVSIQVDGKPFGIRNLLTEFSNYKLRALFVEAEQEIYEPIFQKEESISARAYLLSQGYTAEDIEDFTSTREAVEESQETKAKKKEYFWCDSRIKSNCDEIYEVESSTKERYFLYVPEDIQEEAGIEPSFWTRRLSLRPRCIKSLDSSKQSGDYEEEVILGDVHCSVQYTRELKTNKVDRVLLFEIPSSDGKAVLLFGGRYVSGGLHSIGDIAQLQMSLSANKEPKIYDLPKVRAEEHCLS